MVEHWSEKPGVDSSILSLGILFRLKLAHFVVAHLVEYLGAAAPVPPVYCAASRLELRNFTLKSPSFSSYFLVFLPNFQALPF